MSTDALPARPDSPAIAASAEAAPEVAVKEAQLPADPAALSGDGVQHESAGSAIPRRYLAGATTAAPHRPQFPRWFQALLIGAAALVCLMALTTLLTWPFAAEVDKPVLVCVAVEEYTAGAMPPLPYVRQDSARIVRTARDIYRREAISDAAVTAFDRKDFEQFFSARLRNVQAETHVIYLTAHGFSDDRWAYVIPSDGQPDQPDTGYRIDRLLDAVMELPSRNVLLLLDCSRVMHDVSLGVIENRFAERVQNAFSEKAEDWKRQNRYEAKNISVLLSCGERQQSWFSPVLKGSCFAVAAEYALRGGSDCDLRADGEHRDGWVSSAEFGAFVRQAVANWSLINRHQLQTPTLLSYGREFRIAPVDHNVTLAGLIAPPEKTDAAVTAAAVPAGQALPDTAVAPAATATAAGADQPATVTTGANPNDAAAVAGEAAPAKPVAGGQGVDAPRSPGGLSPDIAKVLEQLNAHWQQAESYSSAPGSLQRAAEWCAYLQTLIRAERLLLTGSSEQAGQVLDRDAARVWKDLNRPSALRPPIPVWSIAALERAPADAASEETWRSVLAEEQQLIEASLQQPAADNLAKLTDARSVEAALLVALGQRLLDAKGQWERPQLVRMAVQTRTAAEGWTAFNRPGLFALFGDSLRRADAERLQATTDLLGRQYESATRHLEAADRIYRQVAADSPQILAQLDAVQQMALAIPSLLNWLDNDPLSSVRRGENSQLVIEFIRSLQAFAQQPGFDRLRSSARLAAAVREQLQRYAVGTLEPADWQASAAVLQTPSLPAELRHKLLFAMLTIRDDTDFRAGYRQHAAARQTVEPLLQNWVVYLDAAAGDAVGIGFDGKTTVQQLTAALERQKQQADAEPLLRMFIRAARGEHLLFSAGQSDWQTRLRTLALSRFVAMGTGGRKSSSADADRLTVASQQLLLGWMASRMSQEANRLPAQSFRNPLRVSADEMRRFLPEFRFPMREPVFLPAATGPIGIDLQQPVAVPLVLLSRRDLPGDADAKFVLQWDPAAANCRIVLDGEAHSAGRIERALGDVLAQREYRFSLQVIPNGDPEQCSLDSLTSFVETSSGDLDWLPWQFELRTGQKKSAEIVIAWDDGGSRKGRIDLYPNQSLPLRMGVRRLTPGTESLRLDLLGSARSIEVPIAGETPVGQLVPVALPAGTVLPFAEDRLTLQLVAGETIVDQTNFQVGLLDPGQCFRRNVSYDPLERRLSAQIERVHKSDVAAPVPFAMTLMPGHTPQPELVQGNLAVILPAQAQQTFLDARIPVGAMQPYRIAISAAGVPRLFRYQLSQQQLDGRTDDELLLRAVLPLPATRVLWKPEGVEIPLHLELDGPEEVEFAAGFDQNHNGQLDDWERQLKRKLWFGRSVQLDLISQGEPPALAVRSIVADVTAALDATGQAGAQTLLIEAVGGPQRKRLASPVYILKTAPAAQVLFPVANADVGVGQPLELTVQVDAELAGAVDAVQFAFDRNGNGEMDEDELVVPPGTKPGDAAPFTQSSRAVFSLPTGELQAGGISLLLRTVAKVNDETSMTGSRTLLGPIARHPLRFSTTGSIAGKVTRSDGSPESGASVVLTGRKPILTGADGSFRIDEVPVGMHAIQAATSSRFGQVAVTVLPAKTVRADITISIRTGRK